MDLFEIPIQSLSFLLEKCSILYLYFEQKDPSELSGSVISISVSYLVNYKQENLSFLGAQIKETPSFKIFAIDLPSLVRTTLLTRHIN